MKKRSKNRNTRVWPVVLTAAIITVIALAAVFGPDVIRYFRSKNIQNDLRDMYRSAMLISLV